MLLNTSGKRLGILGGMGPLASAEFVSTIYEMSLDGEAEQKLPQIILYSDPTIPDRTQYLLRGEFAAIDSKIEEAIDYLHACNVDQIVICCFTAHHVLERLSSLKKAKIISLIDLAIEESLTHRSKILLGCTNGTRQLEIFEKSNLWDKAKHKIQYPSDKNQNIIHKCIYDIKAYGCSSDTIETIRDVVNQEDCRGLICGCTELHLFNKHSSDRIDLLRIDPLMTIASGIINSSNYYPDSFSFADNHISIDTNKLDLECNEQLAAI